MSQFIRKNIDIISSSSRPSSSPSTYNNAVPFTIASDYTQLDDAESSTLDNEVQELISPEDSMKDLTADTTNADATSFKSALETVNFSPAPADPQDVPSIQTDVIQVPGGYNSPISIPERGSEIQSPVIPPPLEHEEPEIVTVRPILRKLLSWFRRGRQVVSDPERQPLISTNPDESGGDPNTEPAPSVPNTGLLVPLGEWFLKYLQGYNPRTVYFTCAVTILVIFLVVYLATGDTTVLAKILRGLICYLLGSSLSEFLFGSGFCPRFVST